MIKVETFFYRWWTRASLLVRISIALLCLLGMEFSVSHIPALSAEMEILVPKPGATLIARNPETHLVLRQKGVSMESQVRVDKTGTILDAELSMEGDEHDYLHFRLPLKPGLNSFTIIPEGRRLDLKFKQLRVAPNLQSLGKDVVFFHQDDKLPESCVDCHDLDEIETVEPSGLKKQVSCATCHQNIINKGSSKHSSTVNQQCLSCHQQSVKPWRIGFPEIKIQNICFSCHTGKKAWLSRKVIHGPVNLGGCTLCHDPHGENHRYQLWAEGALTLCIVCHDDKQNLVSEGDRLPYVHGIVFGEGCVACHDPHATDQAFMLHKPINELCLGCHPRQKAFSAGHPVPRHPIAGSTEYLRPDRELTCSSCHNPHGSSHQYMLIETLQKGRLCRVCHEK